MSSMIMELIKDIISKPGRLELKIDEPKTTLPEPAIISRYHRKGTEWE